MLKKLRRVCVKLRPITQTVAAATSIAIAIYKFLKYLGF